MRWICLLAFFVLLVACQLGGPAGLGEGCDSRTCEEGLYCDDHRSFTCQEPSNVYPGYPVNPVDSGPSPAADAGDDVTEGDAGPVGADDDAGLGDAG